MPRDRGETTAEPSETWPVGVKALDERERQIREDYEWCLRDPAIQQTYGGNVVVVHKRRVWAAARTHRAALRAALRCGGCPPREQLALVFVEGRPSANGSR
jgi:hypothetical protein